MSDVPDTVNSQIIDANASIVTLATGQAPAQAFGMLDAVLLETLGIAMYNAVNRQQGSGMMSAAAVTSACAKMLSVPFDFKPPPPPPVVPPPSVEPLPGPPLASDPAAVVAAANAQAQVALGVLQAEAQQAQNTVTQAQQDMQNLSARLQGGTPPSDAGGSGNAGGASAPSPAPAAADTSAKQGDSADGAARGASPA
ncbi:RebB family R body protein [Burkholderia sp. 22PA0106]|uniref:RebB family R body protein n=1 Tax=Burkholderia sp. 22PA0106 TaxID=3237371 RepID=UPI0039C4A6B5